MRIAHFVIAAAMTVDLAPAAAATSSQCVPLVNQQPSLTAIKPAGAKACPSPASIRDAAPSNVQLAQYGMCYAPGARKCVNGWVAVCQCYSYGCQWMATSYRCGW
jgi:hypothetical protein